MINVIDPQIGEKIYDGAAGSCGFQYENDQLKFFPHPEGYVKYNSETNKFEYIYNYTDHLGNVRLAYQDKDNNNHIDENEVLEENNYYPFGLKHHGYNDFPNESSTNNKYKYQYNGKEFQDELGLNWNDYGARNYDPAIGRWMNVDPLAEQMTRHSPYNYAFNNPIIFIDSDGMVPTDIFRLDQDGRLTNVGESDTDVIYTANQFENDGKTLKSGAIGKTVGDKGTIVSIANTTWDDPLTEEVEESPIQIVNVSPSENPQEIFEYIAGNSTSEISISNIKDGNDVELTYIGNSFKESIEHSLNIIWGENPSVVLLSHDHSQPNDIDGVPSPADNEMAENINSSQDIPANFRIYMPSLKEYESYDEDSVNVEIDEAVITVPR